jgi:hypothetical protein
MNLRQLEEIIRGVKSKVNVMVYCKDYFTPEQMREIRLGLEEKLDVTVYAKPEYESTRMEMIRSLMKEGIDYTPILDLSKKGEELKKIYNNILKYKNIM